MKIKINSNYSTNYRQTNLLMQVFKIFTPLGRKWSSNATHEKKLRALLDIGKSPHLIVEISAPTQRTWGFFFQKAILNRTIKDIGDKLVRLERPYGGPGPT